MEKTKCELIIDNNIILKSKLKYLEVNNNYAYQYFMELVKWVENIIPENAKNSFYHNLETLNIDFDLREGNDEILDPIDITIASNYNIEDNKIYMFVNSIKYAIKDVDENEQNKYFWKQYFQTLLHELIHVASTKYDEENKILYTGFYATKVIDELDIDNKSTGINEAMTEYLSFVGVPNTIENLSDYYLGSYFCHQITTILDLPFMLECYFDNKGLIPIITELKKINPEFNDKIFGYLNSTKYFKNIETLELCTSFVQKELIMTFIKKIMNDTSLSHEDKLFEIELYKEGLITEEMLDLRLNGERQNGYLKDDLNLFAMLENKVNNENTLK